MKGGYKCARCVEGDDVLRETINQPSSRHTGRGNKNRYKRRWLSSNICENIVFPAGRPIGLRTRLSQPDNYGAAGWPGSRR